MEIRLENKGFSVAAFLVAQTVLAISVVGVVKMVQKGDRAARGLASKVSTDGTRLIIHQALQREGVCKAMFAGNKFTYTANPESSSSITLAFLSTPGTGMTLAKTNDSID